LGPSFEIGSSFSQDATPLLTTVLAVGLPFSFSKLCTRQHVCSAREKSLEILHHGRELNPDHREDRQGDSFILPLRYCDGYIY